jgi:hypothetical protein
MGVNPMSILSNILMAAKGSQISQAHQVLQQLASYKKTTPITAHFLSLVYGRKRVDSLMKHRNNPMCMPSKILT